MRTRAKRCSRYCAAKLLMSALLLTLSRLCMSEVLGTLATRLPAAADASQRLRAYVQEIDGFLGQSHAEDLRPMDKIQEFEDGAESQRDRNPEAMVPLKLLQGIPWDWPEHFQPLPYTTSF